MPFLDVVDASSDVAIDDTASNNDGDIDPGEAIRLTVSLTNPWRAAGKNIASATAVLSSSTPGVTIWDNSAAWGPIAAQGTVAASDTFLITLDSTVICGSPLNFTLTTTPTLAVTATDFQLRVGDANGTDPVVTYTKDTNPDAAITDGQPLASVKDTLNITDDFVISDLDLRADSVTHTFTGDLTFMLRSPSGIGVDSISLIGGLIDGGSGDNITNMLIDDDVASNAANDMVQQPPTSAPYTKSWLPVFNAPWPTLAGFPPEDPVGTFSRYDGTSTLGTWSLSISDQFAVDIGTLNSWSILVTPVHFDCVVFAPAVVAAATKTVSAGPYEVGNVVTYTVTLTNNGTDGQADNTGNEFIDVLPAGLTLTNATATSGVATFNVNPNEVTWNGTLAPLGGSVTITITATINAGTQGTTITNQGTFNFDGNNDNVNESNVLTDDPGVGGAADPTSFVVANVALTGTKTVSAGPYAVGDAITYTIVLTNNGNTASPDNVGNEFVDTLPASLTLVSANATSGTAAANIGLNQVTWNGSIPGSGGTVTITINATINNSGVITNQGTFCFDADLTGDNETCLTTDPQGGTTITVPASAVEQVPTTSELGLLLLAMGLALLAAWKISNS